MHVILVVAKFATTAALGMIH